jgi:hypothetical protein
MRKTTLLFIMLTTMSSLYAFEVDSSAMVTNLYWASSRNADTTGVTFNGQDYFWNWNESITEAIGKEMEVRLGWLTDPILRHQVFVDFMGHYDNLSYSVGPVLGAFNTQQNWFSPGLRAELQYTQPGVFFFRTHLETSFPPILAPGDTYSGELKGSLGLYLENGIVTLEAENKTFVENKSNTNVKDNLTKYQMETEIFVKNFPMRLAIDLGYQTLSRIYYPFNTSISTQVDSALFGGRLTWDINSKSTVYLKEENSLFSFGQNSTAYSVPDYGLLFSLEVGYRWKSN